MYGEECTSENSMCREIEKSSQHWVVTTQFQEPVKSVLCAYYQAPVLKSLVNHVNVFHAN